MKSTYHIYLCEHCHLTFAVERAFKKQHEVMCPVCIDDDHMRKVGEGVMHEIPEAEAV